MYPHERTLVEKLADNSFALIGVNSDPDLEEIRQTVSDKNITWRSFWNGKDGTGGEISTEWGISGWPTIFVLDSKGVIRYKNVRGPELDNAITKLLAELGEEVNLSKKAETEEGDSQP